MFFYQTLEFYKNIYQWHENKSESNVICITIFKAGETESGRGRNCVMPFHTKIYNYYFEIKKGNFKNRNDH
jgi:hypothetical protein